MFIGTWSNSKHQNLTRYVYLLYVHRPSGMIAIGVLERSTPQNLVTVRNEALGI